MGFREPSSQPSISFVAGVAGNLASPDAADFLRSLDGSKNLIATTNLQVREVGTVAKKTEGGFIWQPALDPGRPPSGWRDASQNFFAAGILLLGDEWVLFTDSIGAHSIYLREIESTLFFATRVGPLLPIGDSLHVDWKGWGHTFIIGAPLGRSTHFEEVRRLPAATGRLLGPSALTREVSYTPKWMSDSSDQPSPGDIVDALRDALPRGRFLKKPPSLTLSGGWDSRLLAILSRDKYLRRLTAWTTDADDGTDRDAQYASEVARRLRFPHVVVSQPSHAWQELTAETRVRLQYETWLHAWLEQLCREMRERESGVIDGLAGDVLIKGLFVDTRVLGVEEHARMETLFSGVAYRQRSDRVRRTVIDRATEESRLSFFETAGRFEGHVNQLALTVLATRTAHPIALSPLMMFSPELDVFLPFLDPTVVSLTLSIEPEHKTDGRLYRRVLHQASPSMADLPSTNDSQPVKKTRRVQQSSDEYVAWMIASIEESDAALDLVDPEFRRDLRKVAPNGFDVRTTRALQILSLFAQWATANQRYLTSIEYPY